jgi:hypothetical protein
VQTGLTITVEASVGIEGLAEFGTSVSTEITIGYSREAGTSKSEGKEDSISVSITVPARSSITATVVGHRMKADIPFTADMVTIYKNGIVRTIRTSGVYNNLETSHFKVQYSNAKPL